MKNADVCRTKGISHVIFTFLDLLRYNCVKFYRCRIYITYFRWKGFFIYHLHAFFISNTFISKTRLKLAKNQANAKHHPDAELLTCQNYSHSLSTLSTKTIGYILKNKQKNKCVCIHEIIQLIVMKIKMKMKNITQMRHK